MPAIPKTFASFCIFLILSFLNTNYAQNCAIPQLVTLLKDNHLKIECAPQGTVLAELTTKNIKGIGNIFNNDELKDYIDMKLIEEKVTLEVKTPLCHTDQNGMPSYSNKTYIDETWKENIDWEVEFLCTDGRTKNVTFVIPIVDQNTQSPQFDHPTYELNTELCLNGSHHESCPLNFEFPIYVTDSDRDLKNAEMEFYTNSDLIHATGTVAKIKDLEKNDKFGLRTTHKISVHLYLIQNDQFSIGDVFMFNLMAYNTKKCAIGVANLYGETNIKITFGYNDPPNNTYPLTPPIFSSSVYYVEITNIYDIRAESELKNVQPSLISVDGFLFGLETEKGKIRYEMQGRNILTIDSKTGKISFLKDEFEDWNKFEAFEIYALVESYEFLNSSVPLLVYFNLDESPGVPEPCPTTQTPSTTCPECPITGNTTCPVVSCPTPEPCFGSSTTDVTLTSSSTIESTTTAWPTFTTESSGTDSTPTPSYTTTTEPIPSSSTEPVTSEKPITENPVNPSTETPENPSTENPVETTSESTPHPTETTLRTTEATWTTPSDGNSSCCDKCGVQSEFKCPIDNIDPNQKFPDRKNCSIYHQCVKDEDGGFIIYTLSCPSQLVFCPTKQICEYPDQCDCKDMTNKLIEEDYEECGEDSCELCDKCLDGDDENNICKEEGHFADPNYCDMFHVCRKESENSNSFIDCPMDCPQNTIWCQDHQKCSWSDDCPCVGSLSNCPLCYQSSRFWKNSIF